MKTLIALILAGLAGAIAFAAKVDVLPMLAMVLSGFASGWLLRDGEDPPEP